MKQKAYQVSFPATLVVVMVAFLCTIFFANANLSFAASAKKSAVCDKLINWSFKELNHEQVYATDCYRTSLLSKKSERGLP